MAEMKNKTNVIYMFDDLKHYYNGNGGGGNMNDKYITKKEFYDVHEKTESNINDIKVKLEGISHDVSHLTKLMYWLMGIVSAGIVVPLLALLYKTLF
ncbi:MAG: hypothetical protein NC489_31215 [Ruminococcus flavefaciens]|nr:hypothetical protein [Ruminococcus flavefaciens]